MSSFRCSHCEISWPYDLMGYGKCPACLSRTWYSPKDPDMGAETARSMRLHFEFDRYTERREKEREKERERMVERLQTELELPPEASQELPPSVVTSD